MDPARVKPVLARAELDVEGLREAVLRVARMLPDKPPVPVLAGIKVSFLGDRVRFEAGDFSWAGFADVPAATPPIAQAAFVVSGALLARVIRRAPGEDLTLTARRSTLVLEAGRWTTWLLQMPVEDYPDWTGLYTGSPADEDDERVYGNSAEGAKAVTPDGFDRSLRGAPFQPPQLWQRPSFSHTLFEAAPFGAGDWLEFHDAGGPTHLAQVWAPATTARHGVLLVLTDDPDRVEIREIVAEVGYRRKILSYYVREQPRAGETTARAGCHGLRRAAPPPLPPEAVRGPALAA